MTTGDPRATSLTPNPKFVSTRPNTTSSRQMSVSSAVPTQRNDRTPSEMAPPTRPAAGKSFSSQNQRPSFRESAHENKNVDERDPDPESLFVPNIGGEEDETWDAPDYGNDDDNDNEMLGWDASHDSFSASTRPTIQDLNKSTASQQPTRDIRRERQEDPGSGLAPTQRLSQVSTDVNSKRHVPVACSED